MFLIFAFVLNAAMCGWHIVALMDPAANHTLAAICLAVNASVAVACLVMMVKQ